MLNEVLSLSILLSYFLLPQVYLIGRKLTQVSSRCIGYVIFTCIIVVLKFGSGRSSGQTRCRPTYPFGWTIRMGVVNFRDQSLWKPHGSICDQCNGHCTHRPFLPLEFLWLSDLAYYVEHSHRSTDALEYLTFYAIYSCPSTLCPQSCREFQLKTR